MGICMKVWWYFWIAQFFRPSLGDVVAQRQLGPGMVGVFAFLDLVVEGGEDDLNVLVRPFHEFCVHLLGSFALSMQGCETGFDPGVVDPDAKHLQGCEGRSWWWRDGRDWRAWPCQCRVNFPQKRRSKIPQFGRSACCGEGIDPRRSSAAAWLGLDRWRDDGLGANMLGHELGMLTKAVA